MKLQTLVSILSSTAALFTHAATAQKTLCAGSTGDWFSMAVYPQIHNATYNSTFDTDYYSQQQMPLVYSLLKPFGVTGYTITTFGLDAPYSTLTLMYFAAAEQFEEAFVARGEEIYAKVPLFSSEVPPHYVGQVYNITV